MVADVFVRAWKNDVDARALQRTLLSDWGTLPPTGVMVGDSHYDVEAGRRADVTTVLFEPATRSSGGGGGGDGGGGSGGGGGGRRSDELSLYSMAADYDFRVSSHAELLDLFTPHS